MSGQDIGHSDVLTQVVETDADDEDMTVPVGERPMLRLVLNEASGPSSARIERALGLLLG